MIKKTLLLILLSLSLIYVSYASTPGEIIGVVIEKGVDGNLSLKNVYFIDGYQTKDETLITYTLKTLDLNKNVLSKVNFNIEEPLYSPDPSWFNKDGNQIYTPKYDPKPVIKTIFIKYASEVTSFSIEDINGTILISKNIIDYTGDVTKISKKEYDLLINNKTSYYLLIMISVLMVALIILSVIILKKYYKRSNKSEILQIQEYILTCQARKFTNEQIKDTLLKDGWNKSIIDEAFEKISKK